MRNQLRRCTYKSGWTGIKTLLTGSQYGIQQEPSDLNLHGEVSKKVQTFAAHTLNWSFNSSERLRNCNIFCSDCKKI